MVTDLAVLINVCSATTQSFYTSAEELTNTVNICGHIQFSSVQCCFPPTETISSIWDGEPRTAISSFTQFLSSETKFQVQCCFTSTETIRTVWDRKPKTATSTFTQSLTILKTWLSLKYLALLFRYPFHPRVTAIARKGSRPFRQKCRWQVTAKHTHTLYMRL